MEMIIRLVKVCGSLPHRGLPASWLKRPRGDKGGVCTKHNATFYIVNVAHTHISPTYEKSFHVAQWSVAH
jgi:hypothetical protein